MKLLFPIILIIFFSFINGQSQKRMNGCGKVGYDQPEKESDCKDDSEICCFVSLENPEDDNNINFCFPAPEKMELSDVKREIEDNTGFTVDKLACFDFAENLKYMFGNLLLIGLIFI